MGLKAINPLIKAVAKKAYVAPKMEVQTLESLGLKMEQLTGDVVTITTKTVKQIIKEFKPAETIEEATRSGIEEYGLKAFKFNDIDVANDALYVLHKIKSKTNAPLGITEIIEVPIIRNDPRIAGCIWSDTGIMHIASCGFKEEISDRIAEMAQQVPANKIREYLKLLKEVDEGKIPAFQITKDIEEMGLKMTHIQQLPFQTVIHEQGHRAHFLTVGNEELYWKMGKLEEIKEAGITDFSIFEEFMSKDVQDIISSWPFLGSYAKTSPCEFVAEVYSALIHDTKVPDNIMKLYYKYHGPKVL